jgi:hypothetical protein
MIGFVGTMLDMLMAVVTVFDSLIAHARLIVLIR